MVIAIINKVVATDSHLRLSKNYSFRKCLKQVILTFEITLPGKTLIELSLESGLKTIDFCNY